MELQKLKEIVSEYSEDIRVVRLLDMRWGKDLDYRQDTYFSTDLCFFTVMFNNKYYAICAIITQDNKRLLTSEMYRLMHDEMA